MSAAKHTPGPWEVAYLDRNGQSVVKAAHIEIATCWHHCVGSIEQEMHANACLIAAAPDMLWALNAVPAEADYGTGEAYRAAVLARFEECALPAIGKAEGNT